MTTAFTARHPHLTRGLAAAFVALAALLLAVWIAPRASGAAAAWMHTPPVRLRDVRAPGGKLPVALPAGRAAIAPVTLDAGMRFTMAGVVCDVPHAGAVTVRLRASVDGAAWGHWYAVPLEVADESDAATAFTDPVWTGVARYLQVSAASSSRRGPSALNGLRVVAIDPTEHADVVARVGGAVRRVAAAVAGVSFDQPAAAAVATPAIVTRAQWGADERLRSGSPSYAAVKMAFVHHTASGNTYTQADAPAVVRAIYAYHTQSLHWSDIGYNFLIDRFGTVYEGRYGGVSRGVVGAQVGGFNTGSTGISVMGTFTDVAPPKEVVNAVERILAWKLRVAGLNPYGTAKLTCGLTDKYKLGAVVKFPVVAGHRDANFTACPGDQFYALLPEIRANVAQRMGAAVVPMLRPLGTLVSPNGDGVVDSVDFSVAVSKPADWSLVLRDTAGLSVASWSGNGTAATVTWDGTSGGSPVADGVYTAELTAGSDALTATAAVTVDTTPPRLVNAGASPRTFSPNGDGQSDTGAARYTPAESCSVRVSIVDASLRALRWLHGWHAQSPIACSVSWDGRILKAGKLVPAPDGLYRFFVERRDAAGNMARQVIKITVDRTLGFPSAGPTAFSPNGDGVRDASRLGFKLTRPATVTASVTVAGQVVRTFTLGALLTGAQSFTWDGADDAGASLPSCRPIVTLTAVSSIGQSSVAKTLIVDLYRPRLTVSGSRTITKGAGTRVSCRVTDPYSAKAVASYVITDAKGRTVASWSPRKIATGKPVTITWRPAVRGVFTVTWHAVDTAGNQEAAPATTIVTVR